MEKSFLTPPELAERWDVCTSTLKNWRWSEKGPFYHKIGGIKYYLEDLEKFEEERRRNHTSACGYIQLIFLSFFTHINGI